MVEAREWANEMERDAWRWNVSPVSDAEQLAWMLQRWRVDPVLYAIEALRTIPLHYQVKFLLDLAGAPLEIYEFYQVDSTSAKHQVLVSSGHGIGKTRVEATAAHWHKDTHKFSKTIITAPTSDQITGQLWGEITKLHRRQKTHWPGIAAEWNILGSSIQHVNPDFQDWYVIGRTSRPEKPEGLQGAHAADDDDEFGQLAELFQAEVDNVPSGGMMVIMEEASGVADAIRKTLEGALSEPNARLLAMANPTQPDGWFVDGLDNPRRYSVNKIDARDSDHDTVYSIPYRDFGGTVHQLKARGRVTKVYVQNVLESCDGDEDRDEFRVRVRGEPPRSAFDQVIPQQFIDDAQKRSPEGSLNMTDIVIMGLDFGVVSDKHGLAIRQGYVHRHGEEWLPRDKPMEVTLDAVLKALDAIDVFGADVIIGDANGVGRGAMEVLWVLFSDDAQTQDPVCKAVVKEVFDRKLRKRPKIIFFNSGRAALDKKRYYRRRDEMWHKYGRRWLADPRCVLMNMPGLASQLAAPQYQEVNRKIKVETKNEIYRRTGERSGNIADALLQTTTVEESMMDLSDTTVRTQVDEAPFHPPNFQEHFNRIARQQQREEFI